MQTSRGTCNALVTPTHPLGHHHLRVLIASVPATSLVSVVPTSEEVARTAWLTKKRWTNSTKPTRGAKGLEETQTSPKWSVKAQDQTALAGPPLHKHITHTGPIDLLQPTLIPDTTTTTNNSSSSNYNIITSLTTIYGKVQNLDQRQTRAGTSTNDRNQVDMSLHQD